MRIIVVGCGRVGAGLASQLAAEGHEVTILDTKTEAFRRLDPDFSGQALRADGTDEGVLRRAGADGADWFFALTNGDNRNVLAAQLASEEFGVPRVLAKINDPVRAAAYAALGIDTIDRTSMMVDAIDRYMGRPGSPGAMDVNEAPEPHLGPDHVSAADGAATVREARVVKATGGADANEMAGGR
jgi:trk system potassium uptake protein TrkA